MSEEKFTLFYGNSDATKGVFSQWHICRFNVDGIEYNCAEQFMMASKARLFGDKKCEEAVMEAKHPRDQKAIGRLVKPFDAGKWDSVARDLVYEGNYAKFTQNDDLKETLLSTQGTTLVEASPYDQIWGIGRGLSDPLALKRETWNGTNWLGEVLTKLRHDLIAGIKSDTFDWKAMQCLY